MMYKSKEAKDYTNEVQLLLCREKPVEGNVELTVHFFFPSMAGDCDNRLKLLLDSLQGRLFVNDRQVKILHSYVQKDAKNPRVEISICPLAT
jgi:Holliday junction resolvase RusA-like endonuclease